MVKQECLNTLKISNCRAMFSFYYNNVKYDIIDMTPEQYGDTICEGDYNPEKRLNIISSIINNYDVLMLSYEIEEDGTFILYLYNYQYVIKKNIINIFEFL